MAKMSRSFNFLNWRQCRQQPQPPPCPPRLAAGVAEPAAAPGSPEQQNTLWARCVFVLPHFSQAMGSSASAMRRNASVVIPHFVHSYSYTGMGGSPGVPNTQRA